VTGIRVAVADDSSFVRKAIARMLEEETGVRLVGSAGSGEELLDHLDRWAPDAIILDLSMPGMGGLSTLDRIMTRRPTPVIILSTHSKKDAPQTIEALHRGAMDFIDKQQYSLVDFESLRNVLLEKIRQVTAKELPAAPARPVPEPSPSSPSPNGARRRRAVVPILAPVERAVRAALMATEAGAPELVVIGASTGGPPAIERILRDLGSRLPVPIAVVQHMPAGFTRAFAERLNSHLPLHVREAMHEEALLPGTVYIAPGGYHLRVARERGQLRVDLSLEPEGSMHRPSVDVLFASAAEVVGSRAVAALLTGMGQDGAEGMVDLVRLGVHTIAQDEASCVVYGMPRAALAAGGVTETLPLPSIGGRLRELLLRPEPATGGPGGKN
jgi:two-component system chemotaxis response regulator CheB